MREQQNKTIFLLFSCLFAAQTIALNTTNIINCENIFFVKKKNYFSIRFQLFNFNLTKSHNLIKKILSVYFLSNQITFIQKYKLQFCVCMCVHVSFNSFLQALPPSI